MKIEYHTLYTHLVFTTLHRLPATISLDTLFSPDPMLKEKNSRVIPNINFANQPGDSTFERLIS